MIRRNLKIENIPAILWGDRSDKLFIAVHGNMSNKADDSIILLAEKATAVGYQVISFDLPKHGERIEEDYACTPQNCVSDLNAVYEYASSLATDISLFACSIGAYFSLLAYCDKKIKQSLFLSPVINMERIIMNMMHGFNVSEERLKMEKQIELPIGETLDWDYYSFVRENPIIFDWKIPTHILYGSSDNICDWQDILDFGERYQASIKVHDEGEHYFHTEEQLQAFDIWLNETLL